MKAEMTVEHFSILLRHANVYVYDIEKYINDASTNGLAIVDDSVHPIKHKIIKFTPQEAFEYRVKQNDCDWEYTYDQKFTFFKHLGTLKRLLKRAFVLKELHVTVTLDEDELQCLSFFTDKKAFNKWKTDFNYNS